MIRIVYEGNEWDKLESLYLQAGYVKESIHFAFNSANEDVLVYTHQPTKTVQTLFSNDDLFRNIDSFKKNVFFNQKLNLAVFRVVPENSNVYLYTMFPIIPEIYKELARTGRAISEFLHTRRVEQ
jgi:hypothetical protein